MSKSSNNVTKASCLRNALPPVMIGFPNLCTPKILKSLRRYYRSVISFPSLLFGFPPTLGFCILRAKSDLLLALGTLRFRIKERMQKSKSRTQTFWLSWTPFCPPFWNLSQIALGFFRSEINSQPRNNNPQERRFCILRAKSDLLLALGTLRFRIKERRSQRNRWFRCSSPRNNNPQERRI